MSETFKYVKGLDSIRFIAIVLVIIGHWGVYYDKGTVSHEIIRIFIPQGKFGLAFFLVLSGFVISSVLFKARRDMAEGDSNIKIIKNFMVRRALRLLPAYYFLMLVLFLVKNESVMAHPWYFLTHTVSILVYFSQQANNVGHVWSLSMQEQFYVILPWFILYIKEKHLKYVIYFGILIGMCTKYYALFVLGKTWTSLFYHYLDFLGLGVLYAYYMYVGKQKQFESVIKFSLPILLYFGWQMSLFKGTNFGCIYQRSVWAIIGLSLIMYTINNTNPWLDKYFFNNKFFSYFGKISYGLYLYHYPIGNYFDYFSAQYLKAHNIPVTINNYPVQMSYYFTFYAIKFALVLIIASLSYHFIETPIINFKKKFTYLKTTTK